MFAGRLPNRHSCESGPSATGLCVRAGSLTGRCRRVQSQGPGEAEAGRRLGSATSAIIASVANLSIPNLPEPVHRGLRVRAARKGRSLEAEARTAHLAGELQTDSAAME